MKDLNIKRILLYLIIAFVVVSVWKDPENSAHTAGQYLGSVGHFFVNLIDKGSSFIKGLTKSS